MSTDYWAFVINYCIQARIVVQGVRNFSTPARDDEVYSCVCTYLVRTRCRYNCSARPPSKFVSNEFNCIHVKTIFININLLYCI